MGGAQFEYWKHTHLTIDVVPGRGSGFSAEAPRGVRFLTRSRVFDDAEIDALEAAGPAAPRPLSSRRTTPLHLERTNCALGRARGGPVRGRYTGCTPAGIPCRKRPYPTETSMQPTSPG